MTKKEFADRNIGITFDFLRHLIEHPDLISTMPSGAELDFIDKNIPFTNKKDTQKKLARYTVANTFHPVNINHKENRQFSRR